MSTCTKQCYKKNHWSITTPYSLVSIELIVLHWEAFQFRSRLIGYWVLYVPFDACAICHSSMWSGSDLPDQLHSASRTNAVTRIYQLHPISLSPSSRVTGLCHQSEQLCMQRELNPGCWACEDVTLHNHELIHPLVLKLLEVFCTMYIFQHYFLLHFCMDILQYWMYYSCRNTVCTDPFWRGQEQLPAHCMPILLVRWNENRIHFCTKHCATDKQIGFTTPSIEQETRDNSRQG